MLKSITTPPRFISAEEHQTLTSSTPSSFVDIPPVLRWLDEVEISLIPSGNFEWDGKVKGKLWVTEAVVAFLPTTGTQGFELPYPSLILHALTPASSGFEAHLYCQIDDSNAGPSGTNDVDVRVESEPVNGVETNGEMANGEEGMEDEAAGDEIDDDEVFGEMKELRVFVGEGKLQPLFTALSSCSALHGSLLPSGEPSSFPFFPPNANGEFDDAEDDQEDGDADEAWVNVNEDNLQAETEADEEAESGRAFGKDMNLSETNTRADTIRLDEGNLDLDLDPVERFLNLVQWGNVEKPSNWDMTDDAVEDAEDEIGGWNGMMSDDLEQVVRAASHMRLSEQK